MDVSVIKIHSWPPRCYRSYGDYYEPDATATYSKDWNEVTCQHCCYAAYLACKAAISGRPVSHPQLALPPVPEVDP